MSYILDALRKADAQRESDPARGIHAQPARAAIGQQPQPVRERPWFWAAGAVGVAAVAAGGWYLYRDSPAAPQVAVMAVASPEAAPPRVAAALEPAPAPPPAAAVLPPPVIVAPPVAPAPPMDGPSPRAARSAMALSRAIVPAQATVLAPPAGSVASSVMPAASAPAVAPQAQAGTPPQAGSAAAPQPHIPVPQQPPGMAPLPAPQPRVAPAPIPPAPPTPPVAGLPADAQKLVITGGVYSASKSQRMLIVNGQVVGEGADLGSGVSIEEIKPKTAVLRFRGGRYTVAY